MSSTRLTGLALAIGLATLAGCGSGLRVETDWNPERADAMRGWRTWAWLDTHDADQPYDDLDDVRIREAITRQLTRRGFSLAPAGQPADFLVAHQLAIEEELVVQDAYHAGWWSGPWYGPTYVDEVHTGVLVVDLVDPATRELVWRGVAEAPALARRDGPEERRALVTEAIDEMFAELPFRRGPAAVPATGAPQGPPGT